MQRTIRLVLALCVALLGSLAIAAPPPPPQTINYQGYLTNAAGVPTPTSQGMTFRIYDHVVDGLPAAALWTGTQLVAVTNGVFNVILGGPPQTAFPPTLVFDRPYFLSVQMNSETLEMSPRQPLQMSPYAYRAVVADAVSAATTISGTQVTGSISSATIPSAQITGPINAATAATATTAGALSGTIAGSQVTGMLTTATIPGTQVTGAILQGGNTLAAAINVGTKDSNDFNILANNVAAFRVMPASTPNLIGGSIANFVTAGVAAAVVSGGGSTGATIDPIPSTPCRGTCANRVTDHGGSVGGGVSNQAGDAAGTTRDAFYATVGGGFDNMASGASSTVGGGNFNTASAIWSTVGGGNSNAASGASSTIGGGHFNTASGNRGTVGGGEGNQTSNAYSTVSGGAYNVASGEVSTVGGGNSNTASGFISTVGGGFGNTASGQYSFAAGYRATTQTAGPTPTVHNGAFVWADRNFFDFNSTAANEFSARATGGVRFVTAINGTTGVPTAGVTVAAGGAAWASLSDRAAKQDIIAVDSRSILERVAAIPVYTWRYITEVSGATHMGPVAQDFRAAFGLGDSDKTITTVDADGVALAAIQGLNQVVNEKDVEIKRQGARIEMLEAALAAIQSRLGMR